MAYDGNRHTTYAGKVVYRRAPRLFKGADLVRVMLSVSKNETATFANWRAVYTVSNREMQALLPEEGIGPDDPRRTGELFEKFLQSFDQFVALYGAIAKYVPGMAWFVDTVVGIYRWVRSTFPVVIKKEAPEEEETDGEEAEEAEE